MIVMIFSAGIRLPFDKMTPAYDLEFHPSVMGFRAPGAPRWGGPGTTVFFVYNTYEVRYFDPAHEEVEFVFQCLPSEYEKLRTIYEGGRGDV